MIKRQHTEYLWITYPVVSLSQSSASAAYWLCMTEDLNNNFFLSQKSSKYLCKKKRILGIFGRNIVLKEVISAQSYPSFQHHSTMWTIFVPCTHASGCCTSKFLVYSNGLNSQPHPGKIQIPPPPPSQEQETNAHKFPGGGNIEASS